MTGRAGSELPNVPVWAVKYDPRDPTSQTIYAATELGVYQTTDAGQTWSRFGTGLPMVRSTDIALARDGSFMRLSTWGRGVWQLDLLDHGDTPPTASGAGCGCGASRGSASSLAFAFVTLCLVLRPRRHRRARTIMDDGRVV